MSVARKSLSLSVTLSLVLGALPAITFAQAKGAAMGFDKDKYSFCQSAPETMTNLNKINAPKLQQIDDLKEEIEDINKQMQILNSMGAMRDNYQQGLQAILEAQTPESLEAMKKNNFKNLDNMKKVIRNGLILDAIGLLLKNGDLDKKDAFTINSICEKPENESQIICKKEKKFSSVTNPELTQEERGLRSAWLNNHPLDKTLENFKEAYSSVKAKNQGKLKEDIQVILDSIPANISPNAIFSILDSKAPGIRELLSSDVTKENLIKCLDTKNDSESLVACEKLLPDVDKKEIFLTKMTEQTKNAIVGIQDLHTVIDEAAKTNIQSLNKAVEKFKFESRLPEVVAQEKMNLNLKATITNLNQQYKTIAVENDIKMRQKQDSSSLYNQRKQNFQTARLGFAQVFSKDVITPANSIRISEIELSEDDRENAKKQAAEWEKRCTPPKTSDDIKYCQLQFAVLRPKIESEKKKFVERLTYLQDKIRKLQSNDPEFMNIETMKKYVAEKYLRSCLDNPDVKIERQDASFGIAVDNVCYHAEQTLTTIDVLGKNVSDAIAKSKYALDIEKGKKGPATFTSEEMDNFSKVCESDTAKGFSNVCENVTLDKKLAQKEIQKIEREKSIVNNEDKDYWVTSNGRGGFNKVAKKSTMRIIGEGALPVLPQLVPMVFANWQMSANIDMLTSQAIYQKQMLHTYDVYNSSPWMYNFNYFGGTVYSGYGSPFATTTGTTTTGTTTTTGFGF